MKTEPKISKSKFKEFILGKYGIRINKMIFIPKGETSYAYALETDSGKFLLKIHPPSRIGMKVMKNLDFSLKVTFELYSKCRIKNISYPIPSKENKLRVMYGKSSISIFNYLEGKHDNWKMDDEELINFGKLLGKIHRSTHRIKNLEESQPAFEYNPVKKTDFEPELRKCLNHLEKGKSKKPYFEKLKGLILPYKEKILETLEEEKKLINLIIKKKQRLVLCHRDPIELNILINKKHEVFLIDWDGIALAPKEQDLWFHLGHKPITFLKAYESEFGKFKLNKQLLIYWYLDRVLEDFTEYCYDLLFEDRDAKSNKHALLEMKNYLIYEFKEGIEKKKKQLTGVAEEWNKK